MNPKAAGFEGSMSGIFVIKLDALLKREEQESGARPIVARLIQVTPKSKGQGQEPAKH